jgi:hypothetical protein
MPDADGMLSPKRHRRQPQFVEIAFDNPASLPILLFGPPYNRLFRQSLPEFFNWPTRQDRYYRHTESARTLRTGIIARWPEWH